jgi:hypothetical protein
MKSILQEASSVVKAIENAWIASGQPAEFTVNIHQVGKRNFFGITKIPAIVSISYDIQKSSIRKTAITNNVQKKRETFTNQAQPHDQKLAQKQSRPVPQKNQSISTANNIKSNDKIQGMTTRTLDNKQQTPHQSLNNVAEQVSSSNNVKLRDIELDFWSSEVVEEARAWIQDIMNFFNQDPVTIECVVDKHLLRIMFPQHSIPDGEDHRSFFLSIAHLVMQFLKKKHKKRLHRYHIVVSII